MSCAIKKGHVGGLGQCMCVPVFNRYCHVGWDLACCIGDQLGLPKLCSSPTHVKNELQGQKIMHKKLHVYLML